MKIYSMLIAIIGFPLCVSAQLDSSGDNEQILQSPHPSLMVTGRATVEVIPDLFEVTGIAFGETGNRLESLEIVSNQIAELRANLPAIKGLSSFEITTSNAIVSTVRPNGCDNTNRSRRKRPADCNPVAENARVEFKITGQPVEAAGAVVAFASELDLERVTLSGFLVSDPSAAQSRAQALALKDAIGRASQLAEVSGGTLGTLLAISDQKNRRLRWDEFTGMDVLSELEISEIAISDRMSPEATLFLRPEARRFNGEIHAHFEITLPGASE